MKNTTYIITIFLTLSLCGLSGQEKTDSIPVLETGDIHLVSKYQGESTVLRWGFDDPALWYSNIRHGVKLFRRELSPTETTYEEIALIKPIEEAPLEQLADVNSDNEMLFVILQHTWKDWENTTMGDEIGSILEKESNFYSRWSLVHFAADRNKKAAEVAGLGYIDNNIEMGVTYAYKIETQGNIYASDFMVVHPVSKNHVPTLEESYGNENEIVIKWDKEIHDYHFSGYYVERSEDGINFQPLNDIPYVQMIDVSMGADFKHYSYIDSTGSDRKYYYRIRGLDAFGDISDPSNALEGISADRTPPPAPVLKRDDDEMTHLSRILEWTQEDPSDVATYHLERKRGHNTYVIENWADSGETTNTDEVDEEGFYTYRIIAEDANGNKSYSNEFYTKLYDMIPPAIPVGLSGKADTTGIITLLWDEHQEKDVIGYYVYGADGKNRDMQRLTPEIHRSRIFYDTVNMEMLTQKRYYRVVAVDNDYMHSKFSDTLVVDRPDILPPSPALISDYQVEEKNISLTLIPSSSRDVVEHRLYRKSDSDTIWSIIQTFTGWPGIYKDEDVKSGSTYTYKFTALDEVPLESSVVKEVKLTAYNINNAELQLQAIKDDNNKVNLSWSGGEESQKIFIFRSKNNGPYVSYKKLSSTIDSYLDYQVKENSSYIYRIQVINEHGIRSKFSNPVKVEL